MKRFFIYINLLLLLTLVILPSNNEARAYISDEEWYTGFKLDRWSIISLSGVVPEIPMGISFAVTRPKKPGFFLDVRATPVRPAISSHTINLSPSEARDYSIYQSEESFWFSFTMGSTQVIMKKLALYAGLGVSMRSSYERYRETENINVVYWGDTYWVKDDDTFHLNMVGGIYYMLWQDLGLVAQLGYATHPQGVMIGLGYAW